MNLESSDTFPWGDNRRFNSYTSYFNRQFGGRVQKISIDANFTCPNRDGKISTGGCTFCNNRAFNPSYCQPQKAVIQQIEEGIEFHAKRYRRAKKYLAYFQAFSNTYKPVEELEKLYKEALSVKDVIGLVIGTRPDTINDEIISLLQQLKKTHYIMLEFGVESIYDETLKRVNRGHNFETSQKAIELTYNAQIPCGAHFIFGLPGETREMMLNSANIISHLPLTTVKFHQLQIFKDTPMAKDFIEHPDDFHLFTLENYIDFITEFIEKLNPKIIIERFAGEVPPKFLLSEPWMNLRYDTVLQMIESNLKKNHTFQGKKFDS